MSEHTAVKDQPTRAGRGRFIEEFEEGETFTTADAILDEETIIDFARDYDPQAIHTDPDYAADGPFGGIIASGFQTLGLSFRLFLDLGLFVDTSMAGPGMDEVRWLTPVRPGDALHCVVTVLEARRSSSKPDRGFLRLSFDVRNQKSESVMTFQSMTIIKARPD